MSDCNEASRSPNWTGAAVCVVGIGSSPSSSSRADGDPGSRSTKKLPSRKIRGRIFMVASSWMGRPVSLISIFTTAAPLSPLTASTSVTLPTSTPAIRTGELGLRLLTVSKAAVSSYGLANGLAFVNPK